MTKPIIAEFTQLDGCPISVNLTMVTHWEPSDDNTRISFGEGPAVTVVEPYDTVSEYLNPERQAE